MELISKPTPGHWYWKEDTKTLEFSRATTLSLVPGSKSPERSFADRVAKPPGRANRRDHEYVTLEDVKSEYVIGVALNLLEEDERLCMISFFEAVRTQHTDAFLMALLHYLSCFLEKHSLQKKPKAFMLKTSLLEQREMADIKVRTDSALKQLAHMYCVLVLGEGMSSQHHMACGKSRASATRRDRRLYESLYNFCIHVGWVVFRRKELAVIQAEVGRLLRSNAFNPALRVNDAPPEPGRASKKTATYAGNRKVNAKRPAIKSIITQRSPVLISLMPSPKERSRYLFQQHTLHPGESTEPADTGSRLGMFPAGITLRIGILGEPLKQFYYHTLIPLGAEEDEEPETQEKKSTASLYSRGLSSRHSHYRPGTGRQSAVISRATTEAAYSDIA
ncbi:protein phosphatase 1 regulatory subunit 36 isoform X3 [Mixophyes fleayi]|uniref:protein phosphatase 1 regulatory subunit 36 isoform X3 n=1 Tax=Mixophyes fleayi TaxID=3061075 RepID=UPI003F4DA0C5